MANVECKICLRDVSEKRIKDGVCSYCLERQGKGKQMYITCPKCQIAKPYNQYGPVFDHKFCASCNPKGAHGREYRQKKVIDGVEYFLKGYFLRPRVPFEQNKSYVIAGEIRRKLRFKKTEIPLDVIDFFRALGVLRITIEQKDKELGIKFDHKLFRYKHEPDRRFNKNKK
jgi:hypothetical protein